MFIKFVRIIGILFLNLRTVLKMFSYLVDGFAIFGFLVVVYYGFRSSPSKKQGKEVVSVSSDNLGR